MSLDMSGTLDTGQVSEAGSPSGCPCGRSHAPHGTRRRSSRPGLAFDGPVQARVYDALMCGKASGEATFWRLHYAGNCEKPVFVKQSTFSHLHVSYAVRCWKCLSCRRAKQRYWAAAGYAMMKQCIEQGRRTWFGTLTFRPEIQRRLLQEALEAYKEQSSTTEVEEWWDDPLCDERFRLVRKVVVRELQKYWKRLRKAGHKFSYLVVIERHKSGLPHVHWLLHEKEAPITKKELERHWSLGFTKITIVGGRSKRAAKPQNAAHYVLKYLTKSEQSRMIASQKYQPESRVRGSQPARMGDLTALLEGSECNERDPSSDVS